jgi:hypothetical protein
MLHTGPDKVELSLEYMGKSKGLTPALLAKYARRKQQPHQHTYSEPLQNIPPYAAPSHLSREWVYICHSV